jgi:hypothetical protein
MTDKFDLPPSATHQAFGLSWFFPFPFPFFSPTLKKMPADVVVELGCLPPISPDATQTTEWAFASLDKVHIDFPTVAKILVSNGNRVQIEEYADGTQESLALLLMGGAASIILQQRGFFPLHGSGVATARGAVIFVGQSGAGKSTTLGSFVQQGYKMLCDDLAAIRLDDNGVAWLYPGVPLYKLCPDSAEALKVPTSDLSRVKAELSKFIVPVTGCQADEALPVHAIYELSIHRDPALKIESKNGSDKFNILLNHTMGKFSFRSMGLHTTHFRCAIALANTIHIASIRRPENGRIEPYQLVKQIEADFLA